MSLKFQCEHCQEIIVVKFLAIGEKAKCGNCVKLSIVPEDAENCDAVPAPGLQMSGSQQPSNGEESVTEDYLNKLARNANAPQFYGLSTALIFIYLILRLAMPLPATVEPIITFVQLPLGIFLHVGLAISGLIGVSALILKSVARFRYGFYYLDVYSDSTFKYRKGRLFFIIAAVSIELLIDMWFLFE